MEEDYGALTLIMNSMKKTSLTKSLVIENLSIDISHSSIFHQI